LTWSELLLHSARSIALRIAPVLQLRGGPSRRLHSQGRVAQRRVAPLHDLAQPPRHRQHGRVAGRPPIEADPPPAHDIHRLPEHGFGKPEERAYNHAMEVLGVGPEETWMVGDNLEWEIVAPQQLGIYAIWHDGYGVGLPRNSPIRPDRIIRRLSELRL
jgi:hypothetical protein